MEDVLCLSCGGVLFKKNRLDDKGNWAMDPQHSMKLTYEGEDSYFRCPHCGAKNIVADAASRSGLQTLRIVGVKK